MYFIPAKDLSQMCFCKGMLFILYSTKKKRLRVLRLDEIKTVSFLGFVF